MPETTNTWETVAESWGEVAKGLGQLAILLPLVGIMIYLLIKGFKYLLKLKSQAEDRQRERELEEQKPMLDYLARKIAEETATLEKEINEYDIRDVELDQETQDLLNKIGE